MDTLRLQGRKLLIIGALVVGLSLVGIALVTTYPDIVFAASDGGAAGSADPGSGESDVGQGTDDPSNCTNAPESVDEESQRGEDGGTVGGGVYTLPGVPSASASASCSGTTPQATVTWSRGGHQSETVRLLWNRSLVGTYNVPGSRTFSPLANNTTYRYDAVFFWADGSGPDTVTGSASVSGSVRTPDCSPATPVAPPWARIQADGSDGPITIPYNTAATISWNSSRTDSCTVSPTGWTGTSNTDGRSTGNLTSSRKYTLNCSGPGGTVSDFVRVNVASPPDLRVTAFSMPDGNPGQTVNATVTVQNAGSTATDSGFEVAIHRNASSMDCDSTEHGKRVTSVLGAGASRTLNISVVVPNSLGSFTATAMVDSDCNITEPSAEGNNTRTDDYTVTAPPPPPPPACVDGADNDGDGLIDEDDPGCHTDGNAVDPDGSYDPGDDNEANAVGGTPTITANPDVVEQGNQTTVSWDLEGNLSCLVTSTNNDSHVGGTSGYSPDEVAEQTNSFSTDPIFGEATFTIECEGGSDTATVRIDEEIIEI